MIEFNQKVKQDMSYMVGCIFTLQYWYGIQQQYL